MPSNVGIRRRLVVEVTDSLVARFWLRVTKAGPSACWPWQGSLRNGYGAIKHQGKVLSAHVVAWVLANGDVPDGSIITHDCDSKTCCNPAHLKAGTYQSNVEEMHARRVLRAPRGQEIPGAKLSDSQVADIWAMRASTGHGARRISRALGLADHLVDGVIDGKNYRHLMPAWARSEGHPDEQVAADSRDPNAGGMPLSTE